MRSLGGVEMFAAVLAHQGGWDEIGLVLLPVAVVAWLLWLAKRRVSRTVVTEPEAERAPEPSED